MRLLVVHAHPVSESYNAALARTVVESAEAAGHEVRFLDLYAENFPPLLGAEERRAYNDGDTDDPLIQAHIAHLKWATGLIFVYPTWWYAQPAMLKGWLDRVFRPGVTFTIPTETEPLRPALTNIRLIGVVTTLGASRWFWSALVGAPGRKILLRGIRFCLHPRAKTFWLALHDMDTVSAGARTAFLEKVRARIARIPV